jgi:hypothetical protein
MQRASQLPRIIGVGLTPLGQGGGPAPAPLALMLDALRAAAADAGAGAGAAPPPRGAPSGRAPFALEDLDGLIAMPSLMGPDQFMIGHVLAGAAGLTGPGTAARRGRGRCLAVRTLDVGGAG